MRWNCSHAPSLVLSDDHEVILNKRRIIYYLRSVVDTTSTDICVFNSHKNKIWVLCVTYVIAIIIFVTL